MDGDADGRARCGPLSWRTEIQRLMLNVLDMALAGVRAMSVPRGARDAPCGDRGHQERDQKIVAGQRQAEEAPLHFVAADHLHAVETLQQIAGAAEISDWPGAI